MWCSSPLEVCLLLLQSVPGMPGFAWEMLPLPAVTLKPPQFPATGNFFPQCPSSFDDHCTLSHLLVMWSAFVQDFFCRTSWGFIAFLSLLHEENWGMNFLIVIAVILLTLTLASIGLSLHTGISMALEFVSSCFANKQGRLTCACNETWSFVMKFLS